MTETPFVTSCTAFFLRTSNEALVAGEGTLTHTHTQIYTRRERERNAFVLSTAFGGAVLRLWWNHRKVRHRCPPTWPSHPHTPPLTPPPPL